MLLSLNDVLIELDVQAFQKLFVFVADFGQPLFDGNLVGGRRRVFLQITEHDGGFQHQIDFVASVAYVRGQYRRNLPASG